MNKLNVFFAVSAMAICISQAHAMDPDQKGQIPVSQQFNQESEAIEGYKTDLSRLLDLCITSERTDEDNNWLGVQIANALRKVKADGNHEEYEILANAYPNTFQMTTGHSIVAIPATIRVYFNFSSDQPRWILPSNARLTLSDGKFFANRAIPDNVLPLLVKYMDEKTITAMDSLSNQK